MTEAQSLTLSRQGGSSARRGRPVAGPKKKEPPRRTAPLFLSTGPPERSRAYVGLVVARSVGDLDPAVLRLAHTVGSLDQRTALAERLGGHDTVGDAVTGHVRTDCVGTTLAEAHVVLVRTRPVG